jgi:hypothetical protein
MKTDSQDAIDVTPEMIDAGIGEMLDYDPEAQTSEQIVIRILKSALRARHRVHLSVLPS